MLYILLFVITVVGRLISDECLVAQVALYCMYVPTMAFFAQVSDPVIGGTYMTLLNTVTNLGMYAYLLAF